MNETQHPYNITLATFIGWEHTMTTDYELVKRSSRQLATLLVDKLDVKTSMVQRITVVMHTALQLNEFEYLEELIGWVSTSPNSFWRDKIKGAYHTDKFLLKSLPTILRRFAAVRLSRDQACGVEELTETCVIDTDVDGKCHPEIWDTDLSTLRSAEPKTEEPINESIDSSPYERSPWQTFADRAEQDQLRRQQASRERERHEKLLRDESARQEDMLRGKEAERQDCEEREAARKRTDIRYLESACREGVYGDHVSDSARYLSLCFSEEISNSVGKEMSAIPWREWLRIQPLLIQIFTSHSNEFWEAFFPSLLHKSSPYRETLFANLSSREELFDAFITHWPELAVSEIGPAE